VFVRAVLERFEKDDVPVFTLAGPGRGVPDPTVTAWRSPFEGVLKRWRAERTEGWLVASMAILDLDSVQADKLRGGLANARKKAKRITNMPMMVIRPSGDPSVALLIAVPGRRPLTRERKKLEPVLVRTAPDATVYVVLNAPTDDPDDLELRAVMSLHEVGGTPPRA
jgi:hypothetical protein